MCMSILFALTYCCGILLVSKNKITTESVLLKPLRNVNSFVIHIRIEIDYCNWDLCKLGHGQTLYFSSFYTLISLYKILTNIRSDHVLIRIEPACHNLFLNSDPQNCVEVMAH